MKGGLASSSAPRTLFSLLAFLLFLLLAGALLPRIVPEEVTPTMPLVTPPSTALETVEIGGTQLRAPSDFKAFVEKAKKKEVEVRINAWASLLPQEVITFSSLVSQFMREYPGVAVSYRSVAAGIVGAVKASVRAGDPESAAHVFLSSHDRLGELAEEGLVVSLTRVMARETLEDLRTFFLPSTYNATLYKLHVYGLPLAVESLVLACNAELTRGVLPRTFAELEEIMRRHHAPERGRYGIAWQVSPYHVYPFVSAFGGFYYDEEKDAIGLNSAGTVEGYRFFFSRLLPYSFDGNASQEEQLSLFEQGKVPCAALDQAGLTRVKEKVKNLLVGPLPEVEGRKPKPFVYVKLIMITAAAEESKERLYASLLFALWLALNDKALWYLVNDNDVAPAKLSMADFVKRRGELYPIPLAMLSSASSGTLVPKSPKMVKVWGALSAALFDMITVYNERGREEALRRIAPLLERAQREALG
ncbi:MAG: extracellular solute-binding protein [Acidilobaceae archaeon]|nr:extracellular solute-binding protein [Acidilobaceae archaeon]